MTDEPEKTIAELCQPLSAKVMPESSLISSFGSRISEARVRAMETRRINAGKETK